MSFKDKLTLTADKWRDFVSEKFPASDVKLSKREKQGIVFFFILFAIYTLIVAGALFIDFFHISTKWVFAIGYAICAPLLLYCAWLIVCYKKVNKMSQPISPIGKKATYLCIFFLLGICLISWAVYLNGAFDTFWFGAGILYFAQTEDLEAFLLFYLIGSGAITTALVEEFLKSFPFIIAFFVVLKRERDPREKGKGILGNEYYGLIMGIMVGMAFEILELMLYAITVASTEGTVIDLFLQVTIRNWTPIHILGGGIGGFAAGRAERLRFEKGEENLPLKSQILTFIKRFLPFWAIPVFIHFLWNDLVIWISYYYLITEMEDITFIIGSEIALMIVFSIICFMLLIILFESARGLAR